MKNMSLNNTASDLFHVSFRYMPATYTAVMPFGLAFFVWKGQHLLVAADTPNPHHCYFLTGITLAVAAIFLINNGLAFLGTSFDASVLMYFFLQPIVTMTYELISLLVIGLSASMILKQTKKAQDMVDFKSVQEHGYV